MLFFTCAHLLLFIQKTDDDAWCKIWLTSGIMPWWYFVLESQDSSLNNIQNLGLKFILDSTQAITIKCVVHQVGWTHF